MRALVLIPFLLLVSLPLSAKNTYSEENSLIGGSVIPQSDFPAVVYSRQYKSNGTVTKCTSTVVGERVLLIAAHCVDNGGKIDFTVKGKKYAGTCTRNPTYSSSHTADYALCLLDSGVQGIKFESINVDPEFVSVGDKVTLMGYGCIKPGGTGGNDGKLRAGEMVISRIPVSRSNDFITEGKVALCFGDSGGPAFKMVGQARKIISVNSRGDIQTTSYLSSVSSREAVVFFKGWSIDNGEKICGLHQEAIGCR